MCAWTVIVCAEEVPSPVLGWRRTSLSVGVGCGRFFNDQVILGPWTFQETDWPLRGSQCLYINKDTWYMPEPAL